jgi:AcrR family transcriptional regulator
MLVLEPSSRRPRISRDYLGTNRRGRYLDALAELLHEFGREGATVTNVVRLAGTARNSFYEVFGGIEDLIAYGIGVSVDELFANLAAQDGKGDWRPRCMRRSPSSTPPSLLGRFAPSSS